MSQRDRGRAMTMVCGQFPNLKQNKNLFKYQRPWIITALTGMHTAASGPSGLTSLFTPQKRNKHMCSAVLTSAVSTGLWPSNGRKEGGSWWGGVVGQGQGHPGLRRVRAAGGHHRRAGQHKDQAGSPLGSAAALCFRGWKRGKR